jgi:hypothetical protein
MGPPVLTLDQQITAAQYKIRSYQSELQMYKDRQKKTGYKVDANKVKTDSDFIANLKNELVKLNDLKAKEAAGPTTSFNPTAALTGIGRSRARGRSKSRSRGRSRGKQGGSKKRRSSRKRRGSRKRR